MSEIFKYSQKKKEVINTGQQNQNVHIGNQQINPINANVQRQADGNPVANDVLVNDQEYFDQLIESSLDDNVAIKFKSEKMLEEGEWDDYSYAPGKFKQLLPIAKNDKTVKKAEDRALKALKKTYSNADLCTVREYSAMKNYFKNRPKEVDKLLANEEDSQAYLSAFVESILSMEITEKTFTDEYMSNHIAELYEYARKVQKYNEIKALYPEFFDNLPEEKKIMLESKAQVGSELGGLIMSHMKAHGIAIKKTKGVITAEVIKESKNASHLAAGEKYNQNRNKFFDKNFKQGQVKLAGSFSVQPAFKSEEAIRKLSQKINAKQGLQDDKLRAVKGSLAETERVLKIRDEFIGRLSELYGMYMDANSEAEKNKLVYRISRINRRIMFTTRCADHYREYIDFVLGEIPQMSKKASDFIARQESKLRVVAEKIQNEHENEEKQQNLQENQNINIQNQVNAVQEEVQEQKEPVQASAAYASFKTAANNLGTGCGLTEKANMRLVKQALKDVQEKLKLSTGKDQQLDFYLLKLIIIQSLTNLTESCRHYMKKKEEDNEANGSARYGYIQTIHAQMEEMKNYYASLSEEKYNAAKKKAKTFGEIMEKDKSLNVVDEKEKEITDEQTRAYEQYRVSSLQESLDTNGTYNYGNAERIHQAGKELAKLLKEAIPEDEKEFLSKKDKIERTYQWVIGACNEYSDYKNKKAPSFSSGRDRLDTVRKLLGIYERQLSFFKTMDTNELLRRGKKNGSFEDIFTAKTVLTSKDEIKNDKLKSFAPENGDVAYESDLLSGMLGAKGLYKDVNKTIVTDGKGNIRKGFITNNIPVQSSNVRKGIKTINHIIDFARKQNLDVNYSEKVLRSFSTIRIMDYLTGRENRGDEDLLYNTEITHIGGKEVVYISSVKSINDRKSFNKEFTKDPVQLGLVDKDGRFLFPYDIEFADRVRKMDADTLMKELLDQGARLDEDAQKAFKQRFNVLKDLFEKDLVKGWRAKTLKEEKTNDEKVKAGYASVEEKNLASYIKIPFIANRRKFDVITNFDPLNKEENRWIDKNGELIKEVNIDQITDDEKVLEEIEKLDSEESKKTARENLEAGKHILNAKQKIKAIREYKKSDTKSAYLMKKKKADLLKHVNTDKKGLDKNSSKDFISFLQLMEDYGNTIASAQYENQDQAIRRQEKVEGESHDDAFKRVVEAKRKKDEISKLKKVIEKLDELEINYKKLEENGKNDGSFTEAKKKEYGRIKNYKLFFTRLTNGYLQVPTNKVSKNYDFFEEKPDDIVEVSFPEKEEINFEIVTVKTKTEDEMEKTLDKEDKYKFSFKNAAIRGKMVETSYKMRDEKDTPLFSHEPCIEDVCQGYLGDCYMLAAIGALVEHDPSTIKKMMVDNGNGTVTVRFYHKGGKECYVTVKKEVPLNTNSPSEDLDYFAQNCLWVQMIEKAYTLSGLANEWRDEWKDIDKEEDMDDKQYATTKLAAKGKKTYGSISGGYAVDFIRVLTNVSNNAIYGKTLYKTNDLKKLFDKGKDKNSGKTDYKGIKDKLDKIVENITEAENANALILASSRHDLDSMDGSGHSANEPVYRGVVGKHAYTVLGVRKIGGQPYIALRNPWGKTTATTDINETTGGETLSVNKYESTQFLLTPLEFLSYFRRYEIVDIERKMK